MNRYGNLRSTAMAAVMILAVVRLCAAVDREAAATRQPAKPAAGNGPPAIILSTRPAILVTLNGPPRYALIQGASPLLWRVVNTGVLLLKDARGRHLLHCYDGFLEADSLDGPWRVAAKVPPAARGAAAAARAAGKTNLLAGKPDPRTGKMPSLRKSDIPWIYLSNVPTELIVTAGPPDLIAIPGTRLFSARNTAADLFWRQGAPTFYLLAAGRWYRAESYGGPWEVVPADGLPPDFRDIPETSGTRRVRASLPPPRMAQPRDLPGAAAGNGWLARILSGRGALPGPPGSAATEFAWLLTPREWCR